MEYKIILVEAGVNAWKGQDKLEEMVNKAIKQGWIPQGGVVQNSGNFAQAMIKDVKKDTEK